MRRNLVVIFLVMLAVANGWSLLVRVVLGIGLRFVFARQFKEAFLRHNIAGRARETAASVGLLTKKEGLRHRTFTQQGRSPFSGSQSPAPEIFAGDGRMLVLLCTAGDSIMRDDVWPVPSRKPALGKGRMPALI